MKVFPPSRLDTANQCLWRRADTGQEARSLLVTHDEMLQAVRYLELKFCYKTLKRQAASLSYS